MDKEGYINNDSGNNESNLEKAKKIIKKKKNTIDVLIAVFTTAGILKGMMREQYIKTKT